MTCVVCSGTWNVSTFDNLCEDCGVRFADELHLEDMARNPHLYAGIKS